MLFDEEDASLLKKWIVKRLEDISDADSDVLADYVLALLRHEQGGEDVPQLCIDQLEDFLREHTVQFVKDVFAALATKAFRSVNATLTGGGLSVHIPPPRHDSPSSVPTPGLSAVPASPPPPHQHLLHHHHHHDDRPPGTPRSSKRSYYDRDEPDQDDRYKHLSTRDRKAARRGGDLGGGGNGGAAGAGTAGAGDVGAAAAAAAAAAAGGGGGVGWGGAGGPWTRGATGPGRGGGFQPPHNGPATATPTTGQLLTHFGMPPMAAVAGFQPPWMPPPNPSDPMAAFLAAQAAAWGFPPNRPGGKLDAGQKEMVKKTGERCQDYDEKGFCMNGDMCPYEHGIDHIVVPGQEPALEEYDPNDSMIFPSPTVEKITRGDIGAGGGTGAGGAGSIGLGAVGLGGGRGASRGRGSRGSARGGRGGRADFSTTGPSFDRTNTRLVVEQIPDDKLSEPAIREFFSNFGAVETVEIHARKNLAILKFQTWEMAKAAYDSPVPIFDNRFVKVFWCKPAAAAAAAAATSVEGASSNRAKRFSAPRTELPKKQEEQEEEAGEEEQDDEEKVNIEEVKRKQSELQKAHEEKMAKKKANEEATRELQKRTEELLRLQHEEKKRLMEKLAKKHAAAAAAAAAAPATATSTSTSAPAPASASAPARAPASASASAPVSLGAAAQANGAGTAGKIAENAKKADATTAALKAQLEALQAEAAALGISQYEPEETATFGLDGFRGRGRGRGRFATVGRGGYVPRGRGYNSSSSSSGGGGGIYRARGRPYAAVRGGGRAGFVPVMRLDNRTKRVAVTIPDMKGDKEEEFRHYLINNGIELEAMEPHPDKEDTQIFTFQDRSNAEKFVFSGNEIPNVGTVSMAWFNSPATTATTATPSSSSSSTTPTPAAAMTTTKTTKAPGTGPRLAAEDSGDASMADATTASSDQGNNDDSYDLAEDDEGRWLPE